MRSRPQTAIYTDKRHSSPARLKTIEFITELPSFPAYAEVLSFPAEFLSFRSTCSSDDWHAPYQKTGTDNLFVDTHPLVKLHPAAIYRLRRDKHNSINSTSPRPSYLIRFADKCFTAPGRKEGGNSCLYLFRRETRIFTRCRIFCGMLSRKEFMIDDLPEKRCMQMIANDKRSAIKAS